jgi:hypothetical protein
MESGAGIKLLHLPLFDGTKQHKKFQVRWLDWKNCTHKSVFGLLAALQPGGETNMTGVEVAEIDETRRATGKLQAAAKKCNLIVVANISIWPLLHMVLYGIGLQVENVCLA